MVWVVVIAVGLFWLFLWITGWWFAGLVPAAGLVWLWWLGAPDHNLTYAAVLAAPYLFRSVTKPNQPHFVQRLWS